MTKPKRVRAKRTPQENLNRAAQRAKAKGRSPAWDQRELGQDIAQHLLRAWGVSSRNA